MTSSKAKVTKDEALEVNAAIELISQSNHFHFNLLCCDCDSSVM